MTDIDHIEIVGDLSSLPESESGPRHLVWWGNVGFMAIEGTAFVLAMGAYLYLLTQSPSWPPAGARPPDLRWGAVFTLGLLLSELPNLWMLGRTRAKDSRGVRIGTTIMTLCGLLLLIPRGFEFAHLNVPWHRDAYGSVLWLLMVLHTSHVITQLGEMAVQSVWLFTHQIGDDQFADIEDGANYWSFVVIAWLPIYALVYWLPRLG